MSGQFLVLPRGLNDGTNNRVPMADLRKALSAAGATDVSTLLQSGNIILTATSADEARSLVASVMADQFDVDVPSLVRSADDVAKILAADPLRDAVDDDARYLVTFLSKKPSSAAVKSLAADIAPPERMLPDGEEIYVWAPDGVKNLKASHSYIAKRLDVVATARNWKTMLKIGEKLGVGFEQALLG